MKEIIIQKSICFSTNLSFFLNIFTNKNDCPSLPPYSFEYYLQINLNQYELYLNPVHEQTPRDDEYCQFN